MHKLSPALAQLYAALAPYLAHQVDVAHAAHGVGRLLGLPYCQAWDAPRAEVYYDGYCLNYHDLAGVRPVLYSTDDLGELREKHQAANNWDAVALLHLISAAELERWARIVDAARGLHIALNLQPHQYQRKEVGRVG